MVNTLNTGADNLTLADMNEEGANMLMLQTARTGDDFFEPCIPGSPGRTAAVLILALLFDLFQQKHGQAGFPLSMLANKKPHACLDR